MTLICFHNNVLCDFFTSLELLNEKDLPVHIILESGLMAMIYARTKLLMNLYVTIAASPLIFTYKLEANLVQMF